MSNCFCVGKVAGCTCGGSCRCACKCSPTKLDTFESNTFEAFVKTIETKEDRDNLDLPPNCS